MTSREDMTEISAQLLAAQLRADGLEAENRRLRELVETAAAAATRSKDGVRPPHGSEPPSTLARVIGILELVLSKQQAGTSPDKQQAAGSPSPTRSRRPAQPVVSSGVASRKGGKQQPQSPAASSSSSRGAPLSQRQFSARATSPVPSTRDSRWSGSLADTGRSATGLPSPRPTTQIKTPRLTLGAVGGAAGSRLRRPQSGAAPSTASKFMVSHSAAAEQKRGGRAVARVSGERFDELPDFGPRRLGAAGLRERAAPPLYDSAVSPPRGHSSPGLPLDVIRRPTPHRIRPLVSPERSGSDRPVESLETVPSTGQRTTEPTSLNLFDRAPATLRVRTPTEVHPPPLSPPPPPSGQFDRSLQQPAAQPNYRSFQVQSRPPQFDTKSGGGGGVDLTRVDLDLDALLPNAVSVVAKAQARVRAFASTPTQPMTAALGASSSLGGTRGSSNARAMDGDALGGARNTLVSAGRIGEFIAPSGGGTSAVPLHTQYVTSRVVSNGARRDTEDTGERSAAPADTAATTFSTAEGLLLQLQHRESAIGVLGTAAPVLASVYVAPALPSRGVSSSSSSGSSSIARGRDLSISFTRGEVGPTDTASRLASILADIHHLNGVHSASDRPGTSRVAAPSASTYPADATPESSALAPFHQWRAV